MSTDIQRVIVALDAASENRAAIGTAARLAARWGAHLHGVFVEDDDLIRLAHLPFARQVTLGVGVETLDLQQAERQTRAFAERARQELAASAKRHGVEWSFEIVHGGLAVSDGDFLVAGTTTRPVGGHFRVECRWWRMDDASTAARLLAHQNGDREGAVVALLRDRSAGAERLLAAAGRLAAANDARLIVMCPPELAEAADFKAWLDQNLAESGVQVDVELLPEHAMLNRRITELRCRLVALEASADEARPDRLREMLVRLACDVLVVR